MRREKYVPRGGPDGGDGGDGGNIVIQADQNLHTLMDQRYRRSYRAENGRGGSGKRMTGRSGRDLVIHVPCGTLIRDAESGRILADLLRHGDSTMIAKGGRGGRGNAHFVSSVRRTPRFAQPGEPGETRNLILELKLLADVGIVGLPNAGKSTLLSRISQATPKIADYPFTTLTPHLGVVRMDDAPSFVVADIPGLIEGAHQGSGLGDLFLRHVDRCSVLLQMVDVSGGGPEDPLRAFQIVEEELRQYNPDLLGKKRVVAASKIDSLGQGSRLHDLEELCRKRGLKLFEISSVTGAGIAMLLHHLAGMVHQADQEIPPDPACGGGDG